MKIVVGQNKSTKEVEYSCKSSNMLVGSETFRTRSALRSDSLGTRLVYTVEIWHSLGGVFYKKHYVLKDIKQTHSRSVRSGASQKGCVSYMRTPAWICTLRTRKGEILQVSKFI